MFCNSLYSVCLDCTKNSRHTRLHFLYGSCALFTGLASMDFRKFFFKTGSHSTIHTFKNYFVTMFLFFSNKRYPNRPLLFSLFLLLFMDLTALFGTIHKFRYTISTNFYLYLQFLQQKIFNFNKISKSQTNPDYGKSHFITYQKKSQNSKVTV